MAPFADRRGSVAVVAAFGLAAFIAVAALAVDVGTFYLAKRRQQTATDLAALAAASDLDRARAAATATLARNTTAIGTVALAAIETGAYVADPARPATLRFTPGAAPNAVRVTARGAVPRSFSRALAAGAGDLAIETRATAARADLAAFAIGSRLVGVDAGLANALLGGWLGANLSLTALDYRALAALRVDLGRFAEALAARSGQPGASYDTLAATSVRVADALAALGDAARADPRADPVGLAALAAVARGQVRPADRVLAGDLLAVGPTAPQPAGTGTAVALSVDALHALASLGAAAGRGRTVALSLGAARPGLAAASAEVAVGEAAVGTGFTTVGAPGASVRTAQLRLKLAVEIGGAPAAVTLPVTVEVAYARATLTALACDAAGRRSATLGVQPGIVEGWIGAVGSADLVSGTRLNPPAATLLELVGARVTGRAHALVGDQSATPASFGETEIAGAVARTTTTRELTAALLAGLTRDLRLEVSALGFGLGIPAGLDGLVAARIAGALPALDGLLTDTLALLGVGIGQADTWVTGVRCGGAVLVD